MLLSELLNCRDNGTPAEGEMSKELTAASYQKE
jgi:hypothetical protein